jgi:Lon protease-like protein
MVGMSLEDMSFDPDQFCGTARLFPLPNLVVFPHVMQPLHIFEPRYRAMLEEAAGSDQLIAMSVLAPGWESDYDGRPPIRSMACLCRVATHCKTEQGTYNALLLGMRRIKIVRELAPTKRFREAEVTLVEDAYPTENDTRRPELQRKLVIAFRRVLPKLPLGCEQIEQLLGAEIPLGMLTDIVAYALNLDQKIKEDLLAEPLPDLRALLLLECLGAKGLTMLAGGRCSGDFPPAFSEN